MGFKMPSRWMIFFSSSLLVFLFTAFCLFGRVSLSLFDDSSLHSLFLCTWTFWAHSFSCACVCIFVCARMKNGSWSGRCINGYGFWDESTSYRSFWIDFDCWMLSLPSQRHFAIAVSRWMYLQANLWLLYYYFIHSRSEWLIFNCLVTFARWSKHIYFI